MMRTRAPNTAKVYIAQALAKSCHKPLSKLKVHAAYGRFLLHINAGLMRMLEQEPAIHRKHLSVVRLRLGGAHKLAHLIRNKISIHEEFDCASHVVHASKAAKERLLQNFLPRSGWDASRHVRFNKPRRKHVDPNASWAQLLG